MDSPAEEVYFNAGGCLPHNTEWGRYVLRGASRMIARRCQMFREILQRFVVAFGFCVSLAAGVSLVSLHAAKASENKPPSHGHGHGHGHGGGGVGITIDIGRIIQGMQKPPPRVSERPRGCRKPLVYSKRSKRCVCPSSRGFVMRRGRCVPKPPPQIVVKPPSVDVARVQHCLSLAGFDAGPADGKAGRRTNRAFRDFQAANGLGNRPHNLADKPSVDRLFEICQRPPSTPQRASVEPDPGQPDGPGIPQFIPQELLLIVASDAQDAPVDQLLQDFGLTRISDTQITLISRRIVRVSVPQGFTPQQTLQLSNDPRVVGTQPNFLYALSQQATVQYAVNTLGIETVHNVVRGDDTIVAVIDSGVNKAHPSLNDVILAEENFTGKKRSARESHGTAVASIIAAREGMVGVAPGAKVLSARVFARSEQYRQSVGHTFDLLRGVDWAVASGAQVINMSFAGPADPVFETMLKSAADAGIVVVAAAGNYGAAAPPAYPGAYDSVIAVTATDASNKLYEHANRGKYISLSAPGVKILAARGTKGYGLNSGTSMAAAYVSGAAALLRQSQPTLGPDVFAKKLTDTAIDLGENGWDPLFGHGLLDIKRAINGQ